MTAAIGLAPAAPGAAPAGALRNFSGQCYGPPGRAGGGQRMGLVTFAAAGAAARFGAAFSSHTLLPSNSC